MRTMSPVKHPLLDYNYSPKFSTDRGCLRLQLEATTASGFGFFQAAGTTPQAQALHVGAHKELGSGLQL